MAKVLLATGEYNRLARQIQSDSLNQRAAVVTGLENSND